LSGENIDNEASELARVKYELAVLEARVEKANKVADASGTNADREFAIAQMNLLFEVREKLAKLETEDNEHLEGYEVDSDDTTDEEYSRNYNLGYLQGSAVIIGIVAITVAVGIVGTLIRW